MRGEVRYDRAYFERNVVPRADFLGYGCHRGCEGHFGKVERKVRGREGSDGLALERDDVVGSCCVLAVCLVVCLVVLWVGLVDNAFVRRRCSSLLEDQLRLHESELPNRCLYILVAPLRGGIKV